MEGKMVILFKTTSTEAEWPVLLELNPKLVYQVLCFLDFMGSNGTITEIYRTVEMQRKYYPSTPDKLSVHQFWRGADLSVRDYDAVRVSNALDILNRRFPYDPKRPVLLSFLVHDVGLGNHLHIQTLTGGVQ
jgi:hypothetical protein